MGGEEFLIYLSDVGLEQALAAAEKLRRSFEESPWREDHPMTCSFGVASMEKGEELVGLIKRADRALYRAKVTRNAVSD